MSERLVTWIRATAARDFRDDVALVAIYGSYVTGTAGPRSDIDCFFIPRTERGQAFARTFIIDGIGYDIFPMQWERVEGLAELREPLAPLLGDSAVLFAASPAEEDRFLGLRTRLTVNLADGDLMHRRAVECLRLAVAMWAGATGVQDIGRLRTRAGLVAVELAQAVAYANGTYFHRGPKGMVAGLHRFDQTPVDFLPRFLELAAATDADAVRARCEVLLAATAEFLDDGGSAEPASSPPAGAPAVVDPGALASLYEEITSSFTKVRVNCDAGEAALAFLNAVILQDCLDAEVPVAAALPGLMDAHDPQDLSRLRARADEAEAALVRFVEEAGATITRYPDLDAFLLANP
ncbi:MAG: nucleotidyltransferase domain-containing protein [Actinomycetota bacterium]